MSVTVAALYRFAPLADADVWRARIHAQCLASGIRGTILLAREGINGTVSGGAAAIDALVTLLRSDPRLAPIEVKLSPAAAHPFRRLKVKVKPEIVTFGAPEADPNVAVGTYVAPRDWNALVTSPDVLLIDTRNDYEVRVGTFEGATDPGTRTFTGFKDYVARALDPARDRRIAMFCTGGIRCEKATSYLKTLGFGEVYHLEGGILKYLETVPPEESLWRGTCFVFDARGSVDHGLVVQPLDRCPSCGQPTGATSSGERGATRRCALCSPGEGARAS